MLLAGLFGCPDLSATDDRDGDGVRDLLDCAPDDPRSFPGADEVWYDNVDQDCDGRDDDQDGDGHPRARDADDTDPTCHIDKVVDGLVGLRGDDEVAAWCNEVCSAQVDARLRLRDVTDRVDAGCIRAATTLELDHTELTNLAPLSRVERLHALELRENPSLASLGGMDGLLTLDGSLYLYQNPALVDVAGFPALEEGPSELTVCWSDALVSAAALNPAVLPSETLVVCRNGLFSLDGLVDGRASVEVYSEAHLEDLSALGAVESLGGQLIVDGAEALTSLQSAAGLRQVEGLELVNVPVTNLGGLEALESAGAIRLESNPRLVSLRGLSVLRTVGRIVVWNNRSLETLGEPAQVAEVDGVEIVSNGSLRDLEGLGGLRLVRGDLVINDNPQLTTLAGLSALTEVLGALVIRHNGALAQSEIDALLARVQVGGDVVVEDNGP